MELIGKPLRLVDAMPPISLSNALGDLPKIATIGDFSER
jgi:hypothetical protein